MGIASMVLGILSVYSRLVDSANAVSVILALIALLLAIIEMVKHKEKSSNRSMAIAGLIMSLIIIGFSFLSFVPNLVSSYFKWIFWFWY